MNRALYIGADLHLQPNEHLPPPAREWLRRTGEAGAAALGLGDMVDIVPLGRRAWSPQCRSLKEVYETVRFYGIDLYLVGGNHDPPAQLYSLINACNLAYDIKVRVLTHYDAPPWLAYHGHERSDWAIWRYFAPSLTDYMTRVHPRFWYWLCKKLNWLPGAYKATHGETERYTAMTAGIHAAWTIEADKRQRCIAVGHTHKAMVTRWYSQEGTPRFLLDSGDLRDSSFGIIHPSGIGTLEWL